MCGQVWHLVFTECQCLQRTTDQNCQNEPTCWYTTPYVPSRTIFRPGQCKFHIAGNVSPNYLEDFPPPVEFELVIRAETKLRAIKREYHSSLYDPLGTITHEENILCTLLSEYSFIATPREWIRLYYLHHELTNFIQQERNTGTNRNVQQLNDRLERLTSFVVDFPERYIPGLPLWAHTHIYETVAAQGDASYAERLLRSLEQRGEREYMVRALLTPVEEGKESQPDCPICTETYRTPQENREPCVPVELPCKHQFGDVCIRNWLKGSGTCPLCRRDFF